MKVKESESCQLCLTLHPHGLYSSWNSAGQNTGVDSPSFLQIFPAQGSNPGLPHCRWILYQLSHQGSPEEGINKQREICVHGSEELIVLKCLYYLKWSSDLMQSLWKLKRHFFFTEIKINSSKIQMELQKTPNSQSYLEQK